MKKVLFLITLFLTSAAFAEGFKCDNKIISTGASKSEVVSKCGKPDSSEVVSYDVLSNGEKVVKVERLYYDRGYNRLKLNLKFVEGKLAKIE